MTEAKLPRMRKGQFTKLVITKKLWKKFIANFPEHSSMSWRDFYSNWSDIAEKYREHAITNPLGVKLGSYMGEIKLQYLPYKFKAKDYKTSAEMKEPINYLNIESKGKVPKIKWERRWAVKFNKILQFYAFQGTRDMNKRAKDYCVSGNFTKIRVSRNTLGGPSIWRQK